MTDPLAELDFLLNDLENSSKASNAPPPSFNTNDFNFPQERKESHSESFKLPPAPTPAPAPAPVTPAPTNNAFGNSNDSWKNELDDLLSELTPSNAPRSAAPSSASSNPAPSLWRPSAPLPYEGDATGLPSYPPPTVPSPSSSSSSYSSSASNSYSSYPSSAPSVAATYGGASNSSTGNTHYPVNRTPSTSSAGSSAPVVPTSSYSFAPIPVEFSAGGSVYLTKDEQNLIQELNSARTNPSAYADILEKERKPYFEGKHLKLPGTKVLLVTEEGVHSVNDAIQYLRSQPPLPPFKVSAGMVNAAKEAIAEVGPVGETSCESIRRFDNYGRFEQEAVEIASFGTSDAREIVLRFIVCDGQPDRIQRTYIYEPIYSCVGFSIGEHKSAYRTMACINFTKGFIPK